MKTAEETLVGGARKAAGAGYFARFGVTERMIARDARRGPLPRRRLRRRLLPAPRRLRPRPRGRRGEPRLRLGRAGRRRAGGEGRPDRLRLHRGPLPPGPARRAPAPPRPSPTARRATAPDALPRRRPACPGRYPLTRAWEDVRPEREAAHPRRPQRAGLRRRPAHQEGDRLPRATRRARSWSPTQPGRIVEDCQPMTLLSPPALAEQDGRREQNGYNVAGRAGFEFYTPDRARPGGARGGRPHHHPLRGGAAAGRRDAGGARRRLLRHPAPRGHRPRHGGRLQPQGHLHLRRQDRQADRAGRS